MKIVHIIVLLIAVTLGFFLPDLMDSVFKHEPELNPDKYCMASTVPCHQNDVSLTLQHDTVKPLTPSELIVTWTGSVSETLQLSLEGLEMTMGVAKYQLNRRPDGSFAGTLLLPVCSQDTMTWLGTLSDGKSEIYLAIRMER